MMQHQYVQYAKPAINKSYQDFLLTQIELALIRVSKLTDTMLHNMTLSMMEQYCDDYPGMYIRQLVDGEFLVFYEGRCISSKDIDEKSLDFLLYDII